MNCFKDGFRKLIPYVTLANAEATMDTTWPERDTRKLVCCCEKCC